MFIPSFSLIQQAGNMESAFIQAMYVAKEITAGLEQSGTLNEVSVSDFVWIWLSVCCIGIFLC